MNGECEQCGSGIDRFVSDKTYRIYRCGTRTKYDGKETEHIIHQTLECRVRRLENLYDQTTT